MKTILFNPFKKFTDNTLLTSGIVLTLLGSFLGYWMNVRFDGVIDLHFVKYNELYVPFLDNLINIFSIFLLLFPIGWFINKKTRLFDIFIIAMISRLPFYLASLMNINDFIMWNLANIFGTSSLQPNSLQQIDLQELAENMMNHISFFILIGIISTLALIWQIALLYNGFKVASNAKGTRSVILFGVGIIGAEIVSNILIYIFF